MTFAEFRLAYLDLLEKGQEFDLYGYKPAGVLAFQQSASQSAVSILKMRAAKKHGGMSMKRCHKTRRCDDLWQLTTDDGARYLYFQDGARLLILVSATYKMKEKEFHIEIATAAARRTDYLELKKGVKQ